MYDGFSFPTIGCNTLPVEVGTKSLNVTFPIIHPSNQFNVKLRHPWLSSMKAIASTIHKCLEFPHNDTIIMINNSIYLLILEDLVNTERGEGESILTTSSNLKLSLIKLSPNQTITNNKTIY